MLKFRLVFLILAVPVLSCGAGIGGDELLGYTRTAEHQYMLAMDEFEDEDCISAMVYFTQIRKKFPYSRYAVLSDLRSADCKYVVGNFSEAATAYQDFVKAHPTHEEAHYAAFRRGLSYFRMAPGDYFAMPPSFERDLAAMRDARMALATFITNFEESSYQEEAVKLFGDVENALVRHEMYVAKFYLSRDDRRAAVVRLEGIQNEYPKSTLVPDAMFMQAVTFMELDETDNAIRVFEAIISHYPEHHQSKRATVYLQHIQGNKGSKRGKNG